MSESTAITESQASGHPRKFRILEIVTATILISLAPLLAARILYSDEGVSRSAFVTQLALPFLYLLVLLATVLVIARTGILGDLDIAWWRQSRSEGLRTFLLVLVALSTYLLLARQMQRLGL